MMNLVSPLSIYSVQPLFSLTKSVRNDNLRLTVHSKNCTEEAEINRDEAEEGKDRDRRQVAI